ncbi:adenylate/guanylate cyclase domain-containing protein [Yoonia maritima]|uniref:adenylate/guanylate cyclase domain-containing protein n=1 Tax=Yoonia maritima TaxID=1435347 RepID=UPI000D10427E|nr:adenylate/guanylate cyclase domain-containing protein [Yoonia maritima]
MSDGLANSDRELLRTKRLLAKSELRRAELEHLIDTGQSFQRRVLAEVEDAKAALQVANTKLTQEQERTDHLLKSIMPSSVASELKQTGGVVPRRYEEATVMFADFVGFTAHAETLDPLILVQILDQYYSEFDRIAANHVVEKVKTIGDAYMCVSGLNEDPKSATRMVDAARDFLSFVKNIRPFGLAADAPGWKIRIGINSGPVLSGVIGYDRLSYDIWGDTVNTAARVVAGCGVNEILLSRSTYDLLIDQEGYEPLGSIEAKGRGPVDVLRPAVL